MTGLRSFTAAALVGVLPGTLLVGQDRPAQGPLGLPAVSAIAPVRPATNVLVRPYQPVAVPEIRVTNSRRLGDLVRGGILYLTAQDAIALALENNIDLELARYGPILSEWRLQRSQAGGALPGVPSAAGQAGTVAAGQGVAGSQQAAGVAGGSFQAGGNQQSNATVAQIGPVTQNLDPAFQETSVFSHASNPQANATQSAVSNLISDTRGHTGSMQQGFLTGGAVTLRFSENYLKENSPTNILNPSVAPNLQLSFQHALLRGFGRAVNGRQIRISQIGVGTADLNFKSRVIDIVNQVLSQYYGLAAAQADIRARKSGVEVAQTLYDNVKEQIDLGAIAPPELINAETLLINSKIALLNGEVSAEQQEIRLKNLLSRTGTADPELRAARIVPVDKLEIPAQDNLPPVPELVKEALAKRLDLQIDKANVESSEVSALGTASGILPNAQVFGALSAAGLAGDSRVVPGGGAADPYFVGGLGTALGQVFRRNYPTQRAGVFVQAPIHNRQAQADFAIDRLSLRQTQLGNQKRINQIEVDIVNAMVSLRQARVRYDATVKNMQLQQELVKAEETKYKFGASRPYEVIFQQRDLATARATEVSALVEYTRARLTLDRVLGRTLESNQIEIAEARRGSVSRVSVAPPAPAEK